LVTLLATGCGADPATDPVDDDQVDRQPLVAEPDLVAVGTGAGFTGWGDSVEWDPEQALLNGPSLTFAFDALITTAQIDAAPASGCSAYPATDPVDADQIDRQRLVTEPDRGAVGTGAGSTGWDDSVEWHPEQALLIGPRLTFAFDALITTAQIDAAPAGALEL